MQIEFVSSGVQGLKRVQGDTENEKGSGVRGELLRVVGGLESHRGGGKWG